MMPRQTPRTKPRLRPRSTPRLLLAAVLGAGAVSCAGGSAESDARRAALEQQKRQLMIQFADAQNRVRNTQTEALEHASMTPLRERFYELLREHMIDIDPRSEEWLDRARELGATIDDLSRPQIVAPGEADTDTVDRGAVLREFADLERTLRPVQDRAMARPEVAAAFDAMQDSVHALMVQIDPAAEASLAQMRRTSAAVDSVEAELRALKDQAP